MVYLGSKLAPGYFGYIEGLRDLRAVIVKVCISIPQLAHHKPRLSDSLGGMVFERT